MSDNRKKKMQLMYLWLFFSCGQIVGMDLNSILFDSGENDVQEIHKMFEEMQQPLVQHVPAHVYPLEALDPLQIDSNEGAQSIENPPTSDSQRKRGGILTVCTQCDLIFNSASAMKMHYLNEHNDDNADIIKCDACSNALFDVHKLLIHRWDVHKLKPFEKATEQHRISFASTIVNKYRRKTIPFFPCDLCNFQTASARCLYERHKKEKHGIAKPTCELCGSTYERACDLLVHKRRYESDPYGRGVPRRDHVCKKPRVNIQKLQKSAERN